MMQGIRLAVCDDEPFAAKVEGGAVKKAFAEWGISVQMKIFNSTFALEEAMQREEFDLLVIDIMMPHENGFAFVKKLREGGNPIDVIFVSNNEDKVFDSFRLTPLAFIRKNNLIQDTFVTVQTYVESGRLQKKEEKYSFVYQRAIRSVPIGDILYIEGRRHLQELHAIDGEVLSVNKTMAEIEEDLSAYAFARIHRGFLVNFEHVRSIHRDGVRLDNGEQIPISRDLVKEIKEKYMYFLQGKDVAIF